MDFEHQNEQDYVPDEHVEVEPEDFSQIPPQPIIFRDDQVVYVEKPRKYSRFRFFWRLIFGLSVVANIMLFFMLLATAAFVSGQLYIENVVKSGDPTKKIAVVSLEGVINNEMSKDVRKQIKEAAGDKFVKALIIRTNTPGGSVSASDQINHEIAKFRAETGKPVVAFMQSVATSGGYYTSVACDSIIAEPTVITGSIGVIMQFMGIKYLFEEKLGIYPVTIKSGEKKDWPNMFKDITEEQIAYLEGKIVMPAYERFVDLVAQGRSKVLTEDQVRRLADGSIFSAPEALENNLIDQIGYIEDVIEVVESMAGISGSQVVEYSRPFSFAGMLAQSKFGFNIDAEAIEELTVPKLQYLWKPGM